MMASVLPVLHSVSALAAGFLVASVWQGLVLALCVATLLRLLPGLTAAVRSAIWATVSLLVIVFPGLSLAWRGSGALASGHPGLLHASERWSLALLGVWIGVSVLRVSQLLGSAVRLRYLARRAAPVTAAEPIAALLRESRRHVELCLSPDVDRPSVAGFWHPRILLSPELFASLSAPELEHLVLHELEHLRRYDDWTNLLQKLSLAVVPLHPVLLWLDRQMCRERELACDDGVLRHTRARKAYAACLTRLAEDSVVRRGFSLALGALGSRERPSELAGRIHRILRAPEKSLSPARAGLATAVVLACIVSAGAGLTRSPQLVSFTPFHAAAQPFASAQTVFAPRIQPASYRQSGSYTSFAAHQTVFRTVAPQRRPTLRPYLVRTASAESAVARRSARRVRLTGNAMPKARAVPSPYFTMATWRSVTTPAGLTIRTAPAMPAGLVRVIAQDSQVLYAAVPTMDGWLIVQL